MNGRPNHRNKAAFSNFPGVCGRCLVRRSTSRGTGLESASGSIQRDFSIDMKFYHSFHNLGATRCLYTHKDPHCDGE